MKPRNVNSNLKEIRSLHQKFQIILSMLGPFNQSIMAVRTKINELESWQTDISNKLNNFNLSLMELANHEIQHIDSENEIVEDSSSDIVPLSIKTNKKEERKFLKVNGEKDNPTNNNCSTIGSRRTRSSITNYSEDCMNDLDISKDPRALVSYKCPSRSQQVNSRNKQPIVRVDRNKVSVTTVAAVRTSKNKNMNHKNMMSQRVRLQLENSRNRSLRKEQVLYRTAIEPFDKASYQQLHGVSEDDEDTMEIFEDDTVIEEDIVKKREALYSVLARKNNITNSELSVNNSNNDDNNKNSTLNNGPIQTQGSTTEVAVVGTTKTVASNILSNQSSIGIVLEQIVTEGHTNNNNNNYLTSEVEPSSQSPKVAEEFTIKQLPLTSTSSPEIESIDEIQDSREPYANNSSSNNNNYKCDSNNVVVTCLSNSLLSSSPSITERSPSSDSEASVMTIDDSIISFIPPYLKSKRKVTMKNPPKHFNLARTLNVKVTMHKLSLDNISTDENVSLIKSRNTRDKRITNKSLVKRSQQTSDDESYEPSSSKKRNVGGGGGARNPKNGKKYSSKPLTLPKRSNTKVTRSTSRPVRQTNSSEKKISKTTSINQKARSKTLPPIELDGIYRIPKVQKKVTNTNNNNTSSSSLQRKVVAKSTVNNNTSGSSSSKKDLIPSTSNMIVTHTKPMSAIHMPKLVPQVSLLHIVEEKDKTNEEQGENIVRDENSQNHHQQDLHVAQLPPANILNSSLSCAVCFGSFMTAMELSVHYDLSGHSVTSPRKAVTSETFSSHISGGNQQEEDEVEELQNGQFFNQPPSLVPYTYAIHEYNHDQMHYSETFQHCEIPVSVEEEVISMEEEKVDYSYNVDISMLRPIDPNLRVFSGLIPDSVEENDKGENEIRILPL